MKKYPCAHCGLFHLTTVLKLDMESVTVYLNSFGWERVEKCTFVNGDQQIKINLGKAKYQYIDEGSYSKSRSIRVLIDQIENAL